MVDTLLRGTIVTIEVAVCAAVIAAVAALVAGVARMSRRRAVRTLAGLYIEAFRGTSALIQLYIAYFVLPFAGISLSPFAAGVLAIGLNVGSYGAEVVRAGLQAVPVGQREAALVLDMPQWQQFRRVILPNALTIIIRPAGNQLIDLVKLTSLVSLVTLADLTYEAQRLRVETGETVQIFTVVLLIYFALSSLIAAGVSHAERRARRGFDAAQAGRP